jgi:hypothetical protein
MKSIPIKIITLFIFAAALFSKASEDIFENKPGMSLQEMTEHASELGKVKYDLVLLIPLKAFSNKETKFNSDYYVFEGDEVDEFMGALKVTGRFAKPLPPNGVYYGLVGIVSDGDKENSKAVLYVHSEGVIILDDGATKFSLDERMLKVLGNK